MPRESIFDLATFCETAAEFRAAGSKLIEEVPLDADDARRFFDVVMKNRLSSLIFSAVNISLSIELYLKTILIFQKRNFQNTHHLGKLFDCLESRDRVALEVIFRTELAEFQEVSSITIYASKSAAPRISTPRFTDGHTIFDTLHDTGDSYESWRYLTVDSFRFGLTKSLRFHYRQMHLIANILDREIGKNYRRI